MAPRGFMSDPEKRGIARRRGAREARRDSLFLTLVYGVSAAAWVLFSDAVLNSLHFSVAIEHFVSSAKGVVFVLVTSTVLYGISVRRLTQLYSSRVRSSLLFNQAGEGMLAVGVERDAREGVADLVVTDVNPVAADRFGAGHDALVGRRRSSAGDDEVRLRTYFDLVAQGIARGEVTRAEVGLGGEAWELLMAYSIEADLWVVSATDISALRAAQLELRRQEEHIRQAYVDVLDAVTGGKLVVMTDEEIEQELGRPLTEGCALVSAHDLAGARARIREAAARWSPEVPDSELLSAAGEALNNAVKHAAGGVYRVFGKDGMVQVDVTDAGPGIDFRTLPRATLVPGYSTASTLGMGFTIMLQLSSRVLLSTRPGRTEVVLEVAA